MTTTKWTREYLSEYQRNYQQTEKYIKYKMAYDKEYHKLNSTKKCNYTREYNKHLRNELIDLLGGKCVKCGFSDRRALQVDHINGGGYKDCKSMGGMKNKIILNRVKNGSKEYQLLCANCNWIKRAERGETRS